MGSVPIVAVEPCWQVVASLAGVFESGGVGPFAERGLSEALGLAVGLGCVGLGADVPDSETFAGALEGEGFIATAIIGHDAVDAHAEALEVGDRSLEESYGAAPLLIGEDVDAGDARVVIDGDVCELPRRPPVPCRGPCSGRDDRR